MKPHVRQQKLEKNVLNGEPLGLLHGLPIGIKDLEATAGLRTTLGSKLYADHVPTADLGVVANVRNAGGIILGKTNARIWRRGEYAKFGIWRYGQSIQP